MSTNNLTEVEREILLDITIELQKKIYNLDPRIQVTILDVCRSNMISAMRKAYEKGRSDNILYYSLVGAQDFIHAQGIEDGDTFTTEDVQELLDTFINSLQRK